MTKMYKNPFTLDGRVKPGVGVTPKKVDAVRRLVEESMSGDRQAKGMLEEAMSTSDAILNFAHLVNLNFLPQFEDAPRQWTKIASTRLVPDFREAINYELDPKWDSNTLGDGDPVFTAPRIPEGTEYPEAYFGAQEGTGAKLEKRGFQFGFTFEALTNDSLGVISSVPQKMLQVALDTEEAEVFGALVASGTKDNALVDGTNPDGTAVSGGAAFTRDALIQALIQLKQRKHNGRYITFNGGFKLVVAPGAKINAEFQLYSQALKEIDDTTGRRYDASDAALVAGVTEIIESPFVEGNAWYLVPAPGTVGAGRETLQLLKLIGHEAPELRVEDLTGSYVGGGKVAPFEGSFQNDTSKFRMRQFAKGHNWFPSAVLWSPGK